MLETVFGIYANGVGLGITIALILMPIFLIIGIVRLTKRYAYAEVISVESDPIYSSFVLRGLWLAELFATGKLIEEDKELHKPLGADWRGTGLDVLISGLIFLFLGLTWPVTLPVLILWIPVQTMHNNHKNKKIFVKKLRDEV